MRSKTPLDNALEMLVLTKPKSTVGQGLVWAQDEISRLRSLIDEHNAKMEKLCEQGVSGCYSETNSIPICDSCPRHYLIPTGEDNDG